ncbi:MAG: manganese efflux pump [Herpetosiphonaceae bacterium]|nr:manganese efflux pump [Herpetosiphonaceae bacterium]
MIAIALLFLSLGFDTLAVAVGLGVGGLPRERWLRVGVTFACFEGAMPAVGLLLGQGLTQVLGDWASYAAAVILIIVGVLAIKEALEDDHDEQEQHAAVLSRTSGRSLLLTGLAVSLDELAVGFGLGVLRVPVGLALGYIAVQAFAITFIGLAAGQRIGERLGSRAELISGVVLTLLGSMLLLSQATGLRFL